MRRTPQEVRRLQGQRVALRDLASRTELNGKVGRLAGADGERWKVELDGSGEVVKARERNLELTGLAETLLKETRAREAQQKKPMGYRVDRLARRCEVCSEKAHRRDARFCFRCGAELPP